MESIKRKFKSNVLYNAALYRTAIGCSLVNSDRRIKYAKECLNYLTNIDIRFNRNQDLFV